MTAPTPAANQSGAQIADLSYRTYDGPLRTHGSRWWIVALNSMRLVTRKKGFLALCIMASLPFVFPALRIYLMSSAPGEAQQLLAQGSLNDHFYGAYTNSLIWLFLLTLLAGAGSIAADNRANALQVYLAKPITKLDYLLGKWASVFLLVGAVALVPALALYIFCWGTFAKQGFLQDNPTLILRVVGVSLLPALLHSSVMVGVSAFNKNPRVAGAVYAGLYFVGGVIGQIASAIVRDRDAELAVTLRHLSLEGILRGVGQHLYDAAGGFFGMRMPGFVDETRPELLPMVALGAALALLGVVAARARIRAVEVVQG